MSEWAGLTEKQIEAIPLLAGPARHIMLFGGSRSGKTFLLMRAILLRALKGKASRHAILRYRFSHVKASVILDTLPKVLDCCFPDLPGLSSALNKSDWFYTLPNRSEIWFGGLDDKERTEKILGSEFATLYLNECSQIPLSSRNIAMTRVAQKIDGLRQKIYYDCNPPAVGHWTHRIFEAGIDPGTMQPLPNPAMFASLRMNPSDNMDNLDQDYIDELEALPDRMRRRFLLGLWGSALDDALWTSETLDRWRHMSGELPLMKQIVIAVDPSGASGDEDERSDEIGIIVAGLGEDGNAYVLEDLSGRHGPGGESGWGKIATDAFDRWEANRIVAEVNYGGAMVEAVIKAARPGVPFRRVTATRGKVVRAEPVATLYEQGKVRHVGRLSRLEDQLLSMTTAGFIGDKSPDRLDALVWAISDLFPKLTRRKVNIADFKYEGAAEHHPLNW